MNRIHFQIFKQTPYVSFLNVDMGFHISGKLEKHRKYELTSFLNPIYQAIIGQPKI